MTAFCPCCWQPVPDNKVLIDYSSNSVTYNGRTFHASNHHIDLFGFLLARMPRPATHDEIIQAVWGDADPLSADKSIQVLIWGLRKKLVPAFGLRIETIYRRGYRLVKDDLHESRQQSSARAVA